MACVDSDQAVPVHRITVVNRQASYSCGEDKSLLLGMEAQQVKAIRVGCRGGGCGMCKIRILSGEFEKKRMSRAHIGEYEEQQGYALACRILPRGDMQIESDHFVASE